MDPVLAAILRGGLGLLFLAAARHKLRDRAAFRDAVAEYEIVRPSVVAAAAALLVALEALAAVALLAPVPAWPGAMLAVALLVAYGAAIATNLARGRRDLDCGCMGPAARQPIGAGLVIRNAVLAVGALLCLVPVEARALGWLDGLTIAAAVAAVAALYAAIERLMATAPGLAALRQDAA